MRFAGSTKEKEMEKEILDGLMAGVQSGDNAAFEKLYETTKRGVFAFAYSYVGNGADAEDLMQETFLTVKRKAAQYVLGTDARAWLFQIVKNLCLDELRKRKRRADEAFETVGDGASAKIIGGAKVEDRVGAFPALDAVKRILKDEDAEIFLLHAVWEYKHREIAEMKNLPLGTVTWKYKTAVERLQKEWDKE